MIWWALQVDILGIDLKPPSVDDWQSTGTAGSTVSLGILSHRVTPRVFEMALPHWGAMFLMQTYTNTFALLRDIRRLGHARAKFEL